jgi:CO/xanthine dehydrogenase FAD-binding subunit
MISATTEKEKERITRASTRKKDELSPMFENYHLGIKRVTSIIQRKEGTMTDGIRNPPVSKEKKGTFHILPAPAPLQSALEHPRLPEIFKSILGRTPWQWRNEITIERSIKTTNLLPQWVAALLAFDTEISFRGDDRTTPLKSFLQHADSRPGKIRDLRIPLEVNGRVWKRDQVARTPSDKPIVSVITVLNIEEGVVVGANIALTGVWKRQAKLANSADCLKGQRLTDEVIQGVSSSIREEISPQADFLGTVAYRREMAGLLTRRTLEACREKGA